jgi:TctA family transporter
MDVSMLDAAGQALLIILDPYRLMMLFTGVVLGLILGILPGIGGIAGTALLLPFTFSLDPYTAFALLLGLASTIATGDPIPAVLFGVPGGAGSAATVLDGLPMAQRGEAGRALSACYMSSLMGGLFGALLMACTIPLLRPVMLYLGSPELLALAAFGISLVATLSGNTPLRGLTVACFGIMIAMIGTDPQTGTLRWTLESLYLWDGLPLVPVVLGLFALPELCDLAISRTAIAAKNKYDIKAGMWQGAKDCFTNWWLVLRCSWIGAAFGAVPGIGASIIDWLAYGHAMRTEKGAYQTFGRGDVRGVIAAESSNNAKEGGALVPTVAFGVPGSAGMAILLGAFLIHGLVPGPDMLGKNLNITYAMVWSIALANVLGAGLCYLFSGQFAKVATLRYTLILPTVLGIIYIGAFEGSRSWGDLFSLLFFGVLGWTMKQMKWPRPPLVLGFVLGDIIERYMFISVERYGLEWMLRPVVMVLFALAIFGLMRPFLQDIRRHGGVTGMLSGFGGAPTFRPTDLFAVFMIVLLGTMVFQASGWSFGAKIVPLTVGIMALCFVTLSLLNEVFRKPEPAMAGLGDEAKSEVQERIHMDLDSGTQHLPARVVAQRGLLFFGWLLAFMALMATIGLIPTVPLFVIAYMRSEGPEPWKLVLPQAIGLTLFIYIVFDQLLTIPWPQTLLGTLVPALKVIPSM